MSPRIAVIEHQASCPPALFGRWLVEAGCELEVVRPYLGEDLPTLTSYDGVLVLGGEMSAHDDATVPWLGPLKEQLHTVIAAGTPLLGICLGHQLLALAEGGEVAPCRLGQTVGIQHVGWASAAAEDLLTLECSGEERGIHWNRDVVVDVPEGTVVLARDARGNVQVARFGRRAWGIQAHPEADGEVVRRWAESDRAEHEALGVDQEALLEAIDEARAALDIDWQPIARRFAHLVGAQPSQEGVS